MKKPKDCSFKKGTFYGEVIHEGVPFDWEKLQPDLRAALIAIKPYTVIEPQWDDKLAHEVHRVFTHCGLEEIYNKLGRPMDNRVGKQVAVTMYVKINKRCPYRLIEKLWDARPADLGYTKTGGVSANKRRWASVFISMAALKLGFAHRRPYKTSRYVKQEDQEAAFRRMYPDFKPEEK